jgi:hypothetical protein
VSDPVSMARTARESLARGLNALQGDPSIPQQLVDLGQPIAQAMGALYKIEASRGAELQPHAQTALANVQGALAQLQAQPAQHPAVAAAMEAVAGALASVHALSRAGQAQPAQPQQYAQPAAPQYAQPAAPQYAQPVPQAAPQAYAPPPQANNPYAAAPQQAYAPQQGYAAPAQQAYAPPAQPATAGSSSGEAVAAELGAHSPSNFYKGLSGNDIVDHGGLFVSTYKLPKLGSRIRLRVSMPGGYEFEANAVVRWMREANEASTDAPPGFGAQFTDITAEARQLVYRYVRNREPMFHDDL